MSETIEKRLRSVASVRINYADLQIKSAGEISDTCMEAAKEIEKLRAWIDRNYQYVPEAKP